MLEEACWFGGVCLEVNRSRALAETERLLEEARLREKKLKASQFRASYVNTVRLNSTQLLEEFCWRERNHHLPGSRLALRCPPERVEHPCSDLFQLILFGVGLFFLLACLLLPLSEPRMQKSTASSSDTSAPGRAPHPHSALLFSGDPPLSSSLGIILSSLLLGSSSLLFS